MAAAAAGKLLMLLLPAFSLAQETCMQEVLLLRQQMEVEKVAMQSKLDKMAASIEKLEAEAAQARVKSAEMQAEADETKGATAKLVRGQTLAHAEVIGVLLQAQLDQHGHHHLQQDPHPV